MHVHSHMHAASVRSEDPGTTGTRSAMSSATPFSVMADGDGTSASDASASFASTAGTDATGSTADATGDAEGGATASFSSLSSSIQALLLGVGQNGQGGQNVQTSTLATALQGGSPANMTGALQAYGQTSLFS